MKSFRHPPTRTADLRCRTGCDPITVETTTKPRTTESHEGNAKLTNLTSMLEADVLCCLPCGGLPSPVCSLAGDTSGPAAATSRLVRSLFCLPVPWITAPAYRCVSTAIGVQPSSRGFLVCGCVEPGRERGGWAVVGTKGAPGTGCGNTGGR